MDKKAIGSLSREIYTDLSNPDAYSHPQKILKQIRAQYPEAKLSDVREALSSLDSYSRFKPVNARRRAKESMVTRADDADERWQLDLMNVTPFRRRYKFLLFIIDVFSRHLVVVPLFDKSASEVALATELIFMTQGRIPQSITSDSGAEFQGRPFRSLCKKYSIRQYFTVPEITHATIVERVIRTIRHRLGKALSETGNFIDTLGQLVTAYNKSVHSTLGMTPNDAYSSIANRQLALFHRKNRQASGGSWPTFLKKQPRRTQRQMAPKADGAVRLPIVRRRFTKAHEPTFSSQVYHKAGVFKNDRNRLTTRIQQPNKRSSERVSSKLFFYPHEISEVHQ